MGIKYFIYFLDLFNIASSKIGKDLDSEYWQLKIMAFFLLLFPIFFRFSKYAFVLCVSVFPY